MIINIGYSILRRLISAFCPVSNRKVLFIGYYGTQYGCNPKYLSRALSVKNDVDIVWAFTEPDKHSEYTEGSKVRFGSLRFFYDLYTARVIVSNYRMPLWFKKRKGQKYVQTWHSSLRLKKVEGDTAVTLADNYIRMAKQDSAQTDLFISGCRFSSDTFRRAFWYSGEILELGTPRTDSIINPEYLRSEICCKMGIDASCKYILYAPTFRNNHCFDCYNIDFTSIINAMGGNCKFFVRLHPHLQHLSKIFCEKFGDDVLDMTSYDDLQELMLVSDYLISDYSGLIFDYALTKKPCILYTADLEDYMSKERDLYFDIRSLPFPIAKNNDELLSIISTFDCEKYCGLLDRFNMKIGNFESGHASRDIADYIYNSYLK